MLSTASGQRYMYPLWGGTLGMPQPITGMPSPIYTGEDPTTIKTWHFERVDKNVYVITQYNAPQRVVTFNQDTRAVLIDRPAALTGKELFRIEPVKRSSLVSFKSVFFNKYLDIPICYKNGEVCTYDITVGNKDTCTPLTTNADACYCVMEFTLDKQP